MRIVVSFFFLLFGAIPRLAFAQEAYIGITITPLQQLYTQQLQYPDNQSIQDQIVAKRGVIRGILEDNVTEKLQSPTANGDTTTEESLTTTIDKQTAVISTLEKMRKEANVDLSLLQKEEKDVYSNPSQEVSTDFRLTKTQGELLAKKAVLEEQISVLSSLTTFHTSRLQGLQWSLRLEQYHLLITLGKYFVIILLILFVERMIRQRFLSKIAKTEYRYTATKIFTTAVYTFTIIWISGVLFSKNPSLLASVAIIGAGVAIALQDVVKDVIGGISILQHKLFTRGNRISFGAITGEVIDTGLLRTTILEIGTQGTDALERTGKILSIPNALFLTLPITNHSTSSDFIRAEIKLTITFESNDGKAADIVLDILNTETEQYLLADEAQVSQRMQLFYFRHATRGNQVYTAIAADGVELTLRFTAPIGERRPVVSRISKAILAAFQKENDIELAYTTQRILAEVSPPTP